MLEDIRQAKLQKLKNLINAGMDPYPSRSRKDFSNQYVIENFDQLQVRQPAEEIFLTGRIRSLRQMGALIFLHIEDESGKIQALLKKDNIGEEKFDLFLSNIDIGDFVEVGGKLFLTKTNEKTLEAKEWKILSKSLLPLPTEFYGIKDQEERLRKRYLDLIFNAGVKETFAKRSEILNAAREFFNKKGYLEVDTPTLQLIYGGGLARPFKTHHNALDLPLYLRISDELYLKRLIVGGFEKVYEICKDFRNEGIDAFHNPEFTLLEAMTAYQDYEFSMNLIEEFYEYVAKTVKGDLKVKFGDIILDFERPWKKFSMKEIVKNETSFDFDNIKNIEEAKKEAKKLNIDEKKIKEQNSIGGILNLVFEEKVQPNLIQPTIIYDYPVEISPLAKKSAKDARFVERFEHFIFGQEHGNHYSELNDPIDLKNRFIEESKKKKAGFEEAHQTDEDFLEAIEYGMPPVTGIGISIDRLAMILTDTKNIRDVILFPILRPKNKTDEQ